MELIEKDKTINIKFNKEEEEILEKIHASLVLAYTKTNLMIDSFGCIDSLAIENETVKQQLHDIEIIIEDFKNRGTL